MKIARFISLILLFVSIAALSFTLYKGETKKKAFKEDLIELSKIKYGLFNVDEWKIIAADIISTKIEELQITKGNRADIKKKIETFLYKVTSDLEDSYYEEKSQSLIGLIQGGVASLTNVFGKLQKDVPKIADSVINFLDEPANKKALKKYLTSKINEYANNTFSATDYSFHDEILNKYASENRKDASTHLNKEIDAINKQNKKYIMLLFILFFLSVALLLFSKNISANEYLVFSFVAFVFLITGLLLPMIEIDARISEMSFQLLGEPIVFSNQVLYYKSKSILEVVELMFSQKKIDLFAVGILVLTFSVLFPIAKLICSIIYLFNEKENKFMQFMIFKTGKWSMADVMVIAIFMSYIGFSGIITEQLKQIENIGRNVDILSTNESSLQIGFFLFLSFAVLSLLISHKLQFSFKKSKN